MFGQYRGRCHLRVLDEGGYQGQVGGTNGGSKWVLLYFLLLKINKLQCFIESDNRTISSSSSTISLAPKAPVIIGYRPHGSELHNTWPEAAPNRAVHVKVKSLIRFWQGVSQNLYNNNGL